MRTALHCLVAAITFTSFLVYPIRAASGKRPPSPTATATRTPIAPSPTQTPPSPLVLSIEEPTGGSVIDGETLLVSGMASVPENAGILVNGVLALHSIRGGGSLPFIANELPLDSGENVLLATASAPSGATSTVAVTMTGSGGPALMTLDSDRDRGIAPFDVEFRYELAGGLSATLVEMDWDGDGTIDVTSSDPSFILDHTYGVPGVYLAELNVTDANGVRYRARRGILAEDANAITSVVAKVWDGMRASLRIRDVAGALRFVGSASRDRYRRIFEVLNRQSADIDQILRGVRPTHVDVESAEFEMLRTSRGKVKEQSFFIYFARDVDGVWRVKSF